MGSTQLLASLVPGSLIGGRYSVEHALGKGGMGSVYAVRDVSTGRRLAIKCLQRKAAAEKGPAAALFQREYHTLAHLSHPRVIQVYDYGIDAGGRPFYTMELLDGSDLRELSPLPWQRACQVLRDVASSLALLHSRRLLHRDLSPRNVRCTRDGYAKLIDFGTMAPMGVAKDVAGTPPYMAPEIVHGQELDARTDLYGLGALAYWTLTGHDAYPARDTRDLQQFWPRPILPPSALAASIPEALDALVMSLLNLDPQARPSHVAEVIERLTAVAGLTPVDPHEVARAYLISPTLAGRGEELSSFHRRLVRAGRGRGSSVVIRGAAGLGRSRLLQAFVLEAKLSGVHVLCAGPEDARRGELGVIRTLLESLSESAPDLALATFAPHAAVLGPLFPTLYARICDAPPIVPPADRSEHMARVLQALRSWVQAVTEHQTLMLAVDDADHGDEWSAVCLALLATDATRAHMVIAATVEPNPEIQALALLGADAATVDLTPLDAAATTRLLRSVFGDVPNLAMVADWIDSLAHGSPRMIMELSQYLVDRGIARYERGSWTLPEMLRDEELPKSVEQAIDELVASLTPPSRALAETLSLVSEHGHLELAEFVRIADREGTERTYAALDELVAAQVVAIVGTTCRLRQRGIARSLHRGMSEERRRLLHLRLATLYDARPQAATGSADTDLLVAHHRYLGGDMPGCLERLTDVKSVSQTAFGHTQEAVAMYEACLAYGTKIKLPPARLYGLRRGLLRLSSVADPRLIRHAEPALEQLCRDSGRVYLADFAGERDPMVRIRLCIKRARRVYEEMPDSQRGLEPVDALYELGSCAMTLISTYVSRNDPEALGRLESLIEPFRALSPVFELLSELASQGREALLGKDVSARRTRMMSRLELPLEGLDASAQHAIRCMLMYWLGMDDAVVGRQRALEYAATLDRQPLYAPLGAQVRCVYYLFAGNEAEAEASQRRRELLVLQSPFTHITSMRGIAYEALGYHLCGSVLGMGRALAAMQKLAARNPGWKPALRNVEGLYALLRGEPAAALHLLEGSDDAAARVQALLAMGRSDEARVLADEALERCRRDGERDHPAFVLRLHASRALALSAKGERERAARELDLEIGAIERDGVSGMLLCVLHEARARVAIDMDDRVGFRRHVRKLGAIYGRGTSGLRARYEQLSVAARLALMSLPPPPPRTISSTEDRSEVRMILDAAHTSPMRTQRALELLAERAGTAKGFLFGMHEAGLRLAAKLGDAPPPDGLEDMLTFYLSAELDSNGTVPNAVTGTFSAATDMVAWINDGEHLYYPVLLSCISGQRRVVSGVAVLSLAVQRVPRIAPELVSDISRALLDAGDVTGVDAAD